MDNMIKINKSDILPTSKVKYLESLKLIINLKISRVSTFKISRATINFKIGIMEFIDKDPRMEKSCIILYYLKNNFEIIKEVCQENASDYSLGKHL